MRDTFTTSTLGLGSALLLSCTLSGCGSSLPPYQPPMPQYASCTASANQPPLCSVGAAACPLEADTAIACSADSNELIISTAPGAQSTEHLLVRSRDKAATSGFGTFRVQLFTVNGDAVNDAKSDLIPPDEETALPGPAIGVYSDASGAPRIMRLADRTLEFHTPSVAQGAFVADPMPLKTTRDEVYGAAIAPDGTFVARVEIADQIQLAMRTPAGAWSTLPESNYDALLALDANNRLYQANFASQEFYYSIGSPSQSVRVPVTKSVSSFEPEQMAIAGAAMSPPAPPVLSISSGESSGLVVMVPDSNQAYVELTTGGYTLTCNPPNPGPSMCTTATCQDSGERVIAHALTRAEDGTVWLAYLSAVVDRGVSLRVAHFFVDYCERDQYTPHAGNGSLQLVLSRIVPGNPPKIEQRYRAPIALPDPSKPPSAFADFSGRGAALHLIVSSGKNQLRRMVFDTRRL